MHWFGYNDSFAHHNWSYPGAWPAKSTLSGGALQARLDEEERIDGMMEHAARGGSKTVRYSVLWSRVEQYRNSYYWNYYDYVFNRAGAWGIRPILIVTDAPCWAHWYTPCYEPTVNPPPAGQPYGVPYQETTRPNTAFNPDFAEFVYALTSRYGSAAAVDIWNEPNQSKYWAPPADMGNSPHEYAELVGWGNYGAKGGAPAMPVLAGSVAPITDTPGTVGWVNWLDDFYSYQGGQTPVREWFDMLSAHPYPKKNPSPQTPAGIKQSMLDRYDTIRAEKTEAGDPAPIWVTEVGLSTNPNYGGNDRVNVTQQGNYLSQAEDHWIPREMFGMIVHRLYDSNPMVPNPAPPPAMIPDTSWDQGTGTMNYASTIPARQPKYAFCTLAVKHGQAPC